MSSKFHHVGFVVANIAATVDGFARSVGAQWDGCVYEDPHQKVKVTFLTTRLGDPQIELVEPAGEDSPVLRFLREKGSGLHHVCYEVEDLDREMAEMKARGAMIARRPKPAVAFHGRRIAWMLTAEKLLMELLELQAPSESYRRKGVKLAEMPSRLGDFGGDSARINSTIR